MSDDLTALSLLDLDSLREAWRQRFRTAAPAFRTKDLLLRALIYRVEARRHGGPSVALSRRLRDLADAYLSDPDFQAAPKLDLSPGARLTREWNGVMHVVEVTEAGFVYAETTYASLTMVARAITGGHRSGPHFFGLGRAQ